MTREFGWNWTGKDWLYKPVPVDIFSPFHEQGNHDTVKKRHAEMGESEEGRFLDEYAKHVKACGKCSVKPCKVGEKMHSKLDLKWKIWLNQLEIAASKGVEARYLYDAGFQTKLQQLGYHL